MQIIIIQALSKLDIIKSACNEIIKDAIYADSTKSAYIDNIKALITLIS